MNIAVIGSGISGLLSAWILQKEHVVTVFEAADHVGGHANTVDVEHDGASHAVDTGFVVYNETTYPNFIRVLDALGVQTQPTRMSFGVRDDGTGLEFCGSNLDSLFAQRRNLVRLGHYRLLLDILRFNRAASRSAYRGDIDGTLGEYLSRLRFSQGMRRQYLIPLIAAIWSLNPEEVEDFPADFFLQFAARHRLLQVKDQLRWRVISGGSREYVRRLRSELRAPVRTRTPVRSVRRDEDGVSISLSSGERRRFDHVVFATHSDQALSLLERPTGDERTVLGGIPYQDNTAVLHTDTSVLPKSRKAWANWNYRIPATPNAKPVTTYDMSGLQGLETRSPLLITLNDTGSVDPERILWQSTYAHPVYSTSATTSQTGWDRISGVDRTHYCGAYWGYGFHEDGAASAVRVGRTFGLTF